MMNCSIRNVIKGGIIFVLIALFISCEKKDKENLLPPGSVDVDVIEFSYMSSEQEFTVRANGPWSASVSDDSWLSLSLTEGTLTDGSPEKVTVKTTRNPGPSREGKVFIQVEGESDFEISIIQEDGSVQLGEARIEGVLNANQAIDEDNLILIPYTRGFVNETLLVSVTASGEGANGIESIVDYELTIDGEEGELSIPLIGKPSNIGAVELAISVSNGYTSSVSAEVLAEGELPTGEVYYAQRFDLMLWGGDYINKQDGIKGGFKSGDGGYVIDENIPVTAVDYLTAGSNSLITTSDAMAPSYRVLRGIMADLTARGFGGTQIFERPGYLQVGSADDRGSIMTPQIMYTLQGPKTIKFSASFARWENAPKTIHVSINNAGETSVDRIEVENEFEWQTFEFLIENATDRTRVRLQCADRDADGKFGRFFIDNILMQEVIE